MKNSRGKTVLTVVAALFVLSASAGGAILVENSGFEDPVLADGDWADATDWTGGYYDVTDPGVWVVYAGDAGAYNPSASQGFGGVAPDGENVAWTTSFVGYDGGLSQVLSATLEADTQYDLSVLVGNPVLYNEGWTADYRIELLAGGALLASAGGASPMTDERWSNAILTYNSGAAPDQLGEALEIRLLAVDFADWYEVDFDSVVLIPEPATLALLGLGALMLKRKRS